MCTTNKNNLERLLNITQSLLYSLNTTCIYSKATQGPSCACGIITQWELHAAFSQVELPKDSQAQKTSSCISNIKQVITQAPTSSFNRFVYRVS